MKYIGVLREWLIKEFFRWIEIWRLLPSIITTLAFSLNVLTTALGVRGKFLTKCLCCVFVLFCFVLFWFWFFFLLLLFATFCSCSWLMWLWSVRMFGRSFLDSYAAPAKCLLRVFAVGWGCPEILDIPVGYHCVKFNTNFCWGCMYIFQIHTPIK